MAGSGVSGQLPPTWCNDAQSLPELQVGPDASSSPYDIRILTHTLMLNIINAASQLMHFDQ